MGGHRLGIRCDTTELVVVAYSHVPHYAYTLTFEAIFCTQLHVRSRDILTARLSHVCLRWLRLWLKMC